MSRPAKPGTVNLAGTTVVATSVYSYDDAGRLTSIVIKDGALQFSVGKTLHFSIVIDIRARSIMYTGLAVVLTGLSMGILGWLFFRRPGVSLWTVAPLWETNRHLKPIGSALWVVGCVLAFAGLIFSVVCAQEAIADPENWTAEQ
jgi:hypothetical protein